MASETGGGKGKGPDGEAWAYLERSRCWLRCDGKRWKVGTETSSTAFASGGTPREAIVAAERLRPYLDAAEPAKPGKPVKGTKKELAGAGSKG